MASNAISVTTSNVSCTTLSSAGNVIASNGYVPLSALSNSISLASLPGQLKPSAFSNNSIPTSAISGGGVATAFGSNVALYGTLTVGASNASASQPYPPIALSGPTTAMTSVPYGYGTYVASASATQSSYYPYTAFDKSDSLWNCGNTYNSTTGAYIGSTTTSDTNLVAYAGEWLQIQTPANIKLTSYSFKPQGQIVNQATKFYLFGSNDGLNWALINSQIGQNWNASQYFTYGVSTSTSYSFFRVVFSLAMIGSSSISIAECVLYGTQNQQSMVVNQNGNVGMGTVEGSPALTTLDVNGSILNRTTRFIKACCLRWGRPPVRWRR